MPSFLLYGSYGYTGGLIAEQALKAGLRPLLAGRDGSRLREQAGRLGLDYRVVSLDDQAALDSALREVDAVLHCAGPFVHTFQAMADACLRTHKHYVDISGEIEGFEALAKLDPEAKRAGIMLLPGAGFDVVPTDCLSVYLAQKLPGAMHLRLFIRGVGGGISRGTARSGIENMHRQGRIRRDGHLVQVRPAWRVRRVDFGRGRIRAVSIGWGDVSTAFHSTGIPNIETYMALPSPLIMAMYLSRLAGPILYSHPIRSLLKSLVSVILPLGPSAARNESGLSLVIAEVMNGSQTLRARLQTPAAYPFTALTSVEIMKRIIASDFQPGFQTPSRVYSPDFILHFPGVKREDL